MSSYVVTQHRTANNTRILTKMRHGELPDTNISDTGTIKFSWLKPNDGAETLNPMTMEEFYQATEKEKSCKFNIWRL